MEDAIDPLDGAAQRSLVRHVALHQLHPDCTQVLGASGIPHEHPHVVAGPDERARKPVTDEPGTARHE